MVADDQVDALLTGVACFVEGGDAAVERDDEARAAFGNGDLYAEALLPRARHIEVQVLGDGSGEVTQFGDRECSIQRRYQKILEVAPAPGLPEALRSRIIRSALDLATALDYRSLGTFEFLLDANDEVSGSSDFFFIEANARLQVEHTVTECVTGIDIVKAQILIAEGARIGAPESGVPAQADIRLHGHAIQCRVTTENPEMNFVPDQGRLDVYRSASGFGIRLDAGTAYAGIAAGEDLSVKYTDESGAEVAQCESTGFLDQATRQIRWARPHAAAAGPSPDARAIPCPTRRAPNAARTAKLAPACTARPAARKPALPAVFPSERRGTSPRREGLERVAFLNRGRIRLGARFPASLFR